MRDLAADMQDDCHELADGTRDRIARAWRRLFRDGGLPDGCRKAIEDPARFDLLGRSHGDLARAAAATLAQVLAAEPAEVGTILAEARRLVAAARAVAVAAVLRPGVPIPEPTGRDLLRWAYRAATAGTDDAPAAAVPPDLAPEQLALLLDECFRALGAVGCPPAAVAAGLVAARHFTGGRGTVHQLRNVPLLLAPGAGGPASRGAVVRLSLEWLPGGSGQLIASPVMFRHFGAEWHAVLAESWDRVRFPEGADVVWEVTGETTNLDGRSVQAAVESALGLLAGRELYDTECAVSATVGPDGRLGPVDGLLGDGGAAGPKLTAALEAGIRRVVVAGFQGAAVTRCAPGGLTVAPAETVEQARAEAAGMTPLLRTYLGWLARGLSDPADWPGWMGGRSPAELYVEPDVVVVGGRAAGPRGWADELGSLREEVGCRAAVLGEAGDGKTLLVQAAARELADCALAALADHGAGPGQVVLPIVVSVAALVAEPPRLGESADAALRRAVSAALGKLSPGCPEGQRDRLAAYLTERAHSESGWLLLDGLDGWGNPERARPLLRALRDWPCRALLTATPSGFAEQLPPLPLTTYRLEPLNPWQARELVARWFDPAHRSFQRDFEALPYLPVGGGPLRPEWRSPFLLTLLCAAVPDGADELTRTALYDRVLSLLLGDERRAAEWRPVLGELAWQMIGSRGSAPPALGYHEWLEQVRDSGNRPPVEGRSGESLRDMEKAAALCAELRAKRVLVPCGGAAWSLPPGPFVDHLAAWHVACRIDSRGWDGPADLPGAPAGATWRGLVEELIRRPRGPEVIALLAGRLKDPAPLLALLTAAAADSPERHRLALALRCLGELAPSARAALGGLPGHVAAEAFALWWERQRGGAGDAHRHLAEALAECGIDPVVEDRPLTQWLAGRLAAGDATVLVVLPSLRGAVARPALLDPLAGLLADKRSVVTAVLAAKAVAALGPAAARGPIPAMLARRLHDLDEDVRRAAVSATAALGIRGAIPELLHGLAELLAHESAELRRAAAGAVQELAPALRDPRARSLAALVVGGLVEGLRDGDSAVREAAVCAITALGGAAVTEDFPDRLTVLLGHEDMEVRRAAFRAAEGAGPRATRGRHDAFLAALLGLDET
jgi:hypothetical protein